MAWTAGMAAGPSARVLWTLVLAVLVLHGLLLLGVTAPLQVRLTPKGADVPVQVRMVSPAPPAVTHAAARPPARRAPAAVIPTTVETAAPQPVTPSPEQSAAQPAETAAVPPLAQASQAVEASSAATATAAVASEPATASATGAVWPLIPLGALPPSQVMSYRLTGMDKGLTYHASGELRWQHNDTAYEMALSVRAFLLGSRQWRSVGQIEATGLVPRRFSDSWRNERAAHFDWAQQRLVFSGNSSPAPLEPGAQDQVSLYAQLAAAMAGEPERFVPGTRLQLQTATARDAMIWSLALEGQETLTLGAERLQVSHWVCQPRSQYDARLEIWVAASHAWLPVRIRITQTSGSYIDLMWRGTEPLPPLPASTDTTGAAKGS